MRNRVIDLLLGRWVVSRRRAANMQVSIGKHLAGSARSGRPSSSLRTACNKCAWRMLFSASCNVWCIYVIHEGGQRFRVHLATAGEAALGYLLYANWCLPLLMEIPCVLDCLTCVIRSDQHHVSCQLRILVYRATSWHVTTPPVT